MVSSRKHFLAGLILGLALLPWQALAEGMPTLEEVCGTSDKIIRGQVYSEKCKAAYLSGNAALVQNNNTYVHATAAIVCAHSCFGGGGRACAAAGGSGCSSAKRLGRMALADDRDSARSYESAQRNGTDALVMMQGTNDGRKSITSAAVGETDSVALPAACAAAAQTRDVRSRIECAAATDPSLPKWVSSPEFISDFKRATGFSLQDVYAQDTKVLLNDYAPTAIRNSYGAMKKKTSFPEFVKAGKTMLDGMLEGLDEETAVATAPLPKGQDPNGQDPNAQDSNREIASIEASKEPAPPSVVSGSGDEPAGNDLTIFQRVSLGYRRAFSLGLVNACGPEDLGSTVATHQKRLR